jgi:chloramphenicol O-acetyltransferase
MNQNNNLETMMITTFDKLFDFWTCASITRMSGNGKQQSQFLSFFLKYLFLACRCINIEFLKDASAIDSFPIATSTTSTAN